MDFERFTEKSRSLLQHAQTLALRSNHQSLEPEHLLKVMLQDEGGQIKRLAAAAGADVELLAHDVDAALAKVPVVTGSGAGGLRISTDLSKILDNALELAEKSGDKFITAERILQAMMLARTADVAGTLEQSGMNATRLNQ